MTVIQPPSTLAAGHHLGVPKPGTADRRLRHATVGAHAAVVFSGAIFGFFYAWICSTMWGLDAADPRVAIAAMQEMNASVRNAVFFPAFFLTPAVAGVSAALAARAGRRSASRWLTAAALVYVVGGLVLTMAINVPMNETLAAVDVPTSRADAAMIWDDYSGRWQIWNTVRAVASGIALTLAARGLMLLRS